MKKWDFVYQIYEMGNCLTYTNMCIYECIVIEHRTNFRDHTWVHNTICVQKMHYNSQVP